jgi:ABC-2 type transport system permease protein
MAAFFAIARMAFFKEAFYRFELLFNALRAVVFVVVIAAIWRVVYQDRPVIGGFTLEQVVLYTCAAATLTLLFEINLEREIGDRMRTGDFVLQLLKPVHYFVYNLAVGWGTVVFTFVFSALPAIVVRALLFDQPGWTIADLGIGLLMTALGFTLFFLFCHLTALTTFFTVEFWGVEYMRTTTVRFFAGGFLPLTFFPDLLHRASLWLPFPYMIYYPARTLTGQPAGDSAGSVLALQALWCIALLAANHVYGRLIVRRITIHGG